MKDKDLFKEVFSDKLKDHSVDVNPQLWSSIASQVGAGASGAAASGTSLGLGGKIILGVATLAALGTATYFIADRGEEKVATVVPNTQLIQENEKLENQEVSISVKEEIEEAKTVEETLEEETNAVHAADVKSGEEREQKVNEPAGIEPQGTGITASEEQQKSLVSEEKNTSSVKVLETSKEETISKEEQPSIMEASFEIKYEVEKNVYTFTIEGDEFDAIEWDFGNNTYSTNRKAEYFFETPGQKTVIARIVSGDDIVEKEVKIKVEVAGKFTRIPNTFTPTNDGSNDTYFIEAEGIKRANIRIVDQQQQVVYETDDINFIWNGLGRDGNVVPEGTYYIIIIAEDMNGYPLNHHGTITIFR
ncbi:gliding motility-associated C-terminal domain-containing protein [Lishizhenia tianjinensis]|uniref:Gliding motility-associated C-terminal domain-containing protein n=1 Tax=Lishizhenia tianjinensis TaxID=477690 RepID=A0A1I7BBG5_9FLAO|nr:gliding motility-associated C-terminal domain-containing protein [Lishizhenia tianjinensis]SFT84487.1 gliding motility-associated C-terminal domain-containing protein [Lishizhenia tianjinensis]